MEVGGGGGGGEEGGGEGGEEDGMLAASCTIINNIPHFIMCKHRLHFWLSITQELLDQTQFFFAYVSGLHLLNAATKKYKYKKLVAVTL